MRKRIDREQIRSLLLEGKTNLQIAELVGCSYHTVSRERGDMRSMPGVRTKKAPLGDIPQLMDEGEIVRHWCALSDKSGGIKILSELNLCRQDVIVDILRRHGCEVRSRRTRWVRKEA